MKLSRPGIIICCLLGAVTQVTALDLGPDEALHLRQKGEIIALEDIITIAKKQYPGSVLLEVELEKENATYIYEVELLTANGITRELQLDARNGFILSDNEDD